MSVKIPSSFDFGVNLRPVDFDGWIDSKEMQNPQQIGYWLEYWSAAYRHLLELTSSQILFVNYDALCKNPISGLRHVAEAVRIRNSENFVGMSDGIRTARKVEVSLGGVPVTLIKKVEAIHHQLQSSAINH